MFNYKLLVWHSSIIFSLSFQIYPFATSLLWVNTRVVVGYSNYNTYHNISIQNYFIKSSFKVPSKRDREKKEYKKEFNLHLRTISTLFSESLLWIQEVYWSCSNSPDKLCSVEIHFSAILLDQLSAIFGSRSNGFGSQRIFHGSIAPCAISEDCIVASTNRDWRNLWKEGSTANHHISKHIPVALYW